MSEPKHDKTSDPAGPFADDEQADLAALIGSRICHDLISPIGAIGNGVELLAMARADSPEVALIAESAANASGRVRFFRVAFGQAAPGQTMPAAETRQTVQGYFRGSRITAAWDVPQGIARTDARLLFLLLLCLESAMPWGGRIEVSPAGDRFRLVARADRLKCDSALWGRVAPRPKPASERFPPEPSLVHFALAGPALARCGRALSAEFGEAGITLTV
ncbi:MAG: histidine phosphotransferase family protein [Rhodobacteraceae bacterium]|nr:histidine phosphotransferase family protein [Paracoccaceae bacterium]